MADSPGILLFLARTDALGKLVLLALLLMSLACWYQIGLKLWQHAGDSRQRRNFMASLSTCPSPAALEQLLAHRRDNGSHTLLARYALQACRQWSDRRPERSAITLSAPDVFLLQAFNRGLAEAGARLDEGLSVIASVGSTAPFVGLFGTVWGIYHALIAIGAEGTGSLDKVAGPVGEALVMTACGLAVAIPAVLAYNALGRANRRTLQTLEGFGHELLAFLVTGLAPEAPAATAGGEHRGYRAEAA